MKYRVLILCSFLCFSLYGIADSNNYLFYYQQINEADYYFYQQDYQKAQDKFNCGFNKVEYPFEIDLYKYSICLINTGFVEKGIEILDTNQFTRLGFSEYHSAYFNPINDSLKQIILNRNKSFISQKEKVFESKNLKLLNLIDSLKTIDRDIRLRLINHEFDSEKGIRDSIYKIDLMATNLIDSIIKLHGYLGGVNWSSTRSPMGPLHLLMLHCDKNWFKNNISFFQDELKKGHILPSEYAIFVDRKIYSETKGEKSYYNYWGEKFSSKEVSPNEFYKRCFKIGLSPYYIYSERLPPFGSQPIRTEYFQFYANHLEKN